jgi:hypothetical protein
MKGPRGWHFWRPRREGDTTRAPVGLVWMATLVLFGLPLLFHLLVGDPSAFLPSVLFGLGAVTMAQNPDGILSLTEERSFRRRQKRQAARPAPVVVAARGGTQSDAGSGLASLVPNGVSPIDNDPSPGLVHMSSIPLSSSE